MALYIIELKFLEILFFLFCWREREKYGKLKLHFSGLLSTSRWGGRERTSHCPRDLIQLFDSPTHYLIGQLAGQLD